MQLGLCAQRACASIRPHITILQAQQARYAAFHTANSFAGRMPVSWRKVLVLPISLLAISCGSSTTPTERPAAENGAALSSRAAHGKALFQDKCTQCHRLNREVVGPALAGSITRWSGDTSAAETLHPAQRRSNRKRRPVCGRPLQPLGQSPDDGLHRINRRRSFGAVGIHRHGRRSER